MKPKNVLITGATSGIGYELAKIFAQNGHNLVLVARNRENLKKTADEMKAFSNLKSQITVIAIDLFERDSAKEIYEIIEDLGLSIDILINNAGQGEWGIFTKTDLDREIDIIELNIISTISLTKYFLRDMIKRNDGKILMLASAVSKAPSPYMSVYAATKAFILSFGEALIKEIEDTEVTITILQPDATDTDFFHKAKAENTIAYREKKLTDPEKIALDAYRSLNEGKDIEVPGFQNKIQQALNTIMPDNMIAANMEKQMKESRKKEGRTQPSHVASLRERKSINNYKNAENGDY
jgi:short-subunit dehydrogenase